MNNDWVYDCEVLPNIFTCAFEHLHAPFTAEFEISEWVNQSVELVEFLYYLRDSGARMIGYNNLGYDYPLIHMLLKAGRLTHVQFYAKSQAIITQQDGDDEGRWIHQVYQKDRVIPQIDVMKANHFEFGSAKATGLKALEFAMRSESIDELNLPFTKPIALEQRARLKTYNRYDVSQTKKFAHLCHDMLQFREELCRKYPTKDWLNFNDVKIGIEYFILRLEAAGIDCYEYGPDGRKPRQTRRASINLNDAILPWIQFETPEFQRVLNFLRSQTITETKGVFKGLTATVGGIEWVFGLGGIHGSVSNQIVVSDEENIIEDIDVEGYYPSTMIAQRFKPAHYPDIFCDIYASLKEERKKYKKGTVENLMLKLSGNGVFGKTNEAFSVVHDPMVTMQTTLNGQMLLCLLAETLLKIPNLRIVQANTDGLTLNYPRKRQENVRRVVEWWEGITKLKMEYAEYNFMAIRDVNNYIARKVDGTIKRKGAYEWKREWHQDSSALIIPKAAERALLYGESIRQVIENWPDPLDYMLRIKVPKSGYLQYGDVQVQNTSRYLVTKNGKPLKKWLPPLKGKSEWRSFAVESGWLCTVCNRLSDAEGVVPDYDFYISETEKLVLGMK